MLNRHAIVLFLGNAAMLLMYPPPGSALALIGAWFLVLLVGLLLDNGEPGPRTNLGHALQFGGSALLLADVALMLPAGRVALPPILAGLGICLAALGVLGEMRFAYRRLKWFISMQALGDVLFIAAFAWVLRAHTVTPSRAGWVFIGIAGLISLYAAVSNLALQLSRLKNRQAGWRFRVLGVEPDALALQTPTGRARLPWNHVQALKRLDQRHLLLMLPAPLPNDLAGLGLPLEELRKSSGPVGPGQASPPDAFAFILHEQELGQALSDAERELSPHVRMAADLQSPTKT